MKSTNKNTLLKFNSGGINYDDKMDKYIEFVEKLNTIIDNIYALDDLFHYFNFDGETVSEYSLNSNIKFNQFSCMDIPKSVYDKLGMLEDIMEKYDIESVEELDETLEDNKSAKDAFIKILQDRNDWENACKFASEECNKLSGYDEIIDELNFSPYTSEYFYQQVRNMESNNGQ